MKVFIAGATGALGMPLARALVSKRYEVVGTTRSETKRNALEKIGVTPVVLDILDSEAVTRTLAQVRPEAVIHLATALPKHGPTKASDMRATNELRVRGTANLLQASIAAGVKRIVAESMTFAYGFGDHGSVPVRESEFAPTREPYAWMNEIVDSLRSLEDRLLTANAQGLIEAIPLRYGLFYGSDPITRYLLEMLEKRFLPIVSGAHGLASWIYLEDAVRATVLALERGRAGEIYNIVDDEPVSTNDFLTYAASLIGAKRPFAVPLWLLRWMMPYTDVVFSTRLPVDNSKAKTELEWQPQFPSYREGLRQAVAAYEQSKPQPQRKAKATREQIRR